jgi:hypothetical protein
VWLPSNLPQRTSNPRHSIDTTRVLSYDLDQSTLLQRLIKVLSQCPDPKSKKLMREPSYKLPLGYCDNGHIPEKIFLISLKHRYRFIYSIEEKPCFRHLLYIFQGETIRDFERIVSSDRRQRQKIEDKGRENDEAQNGEAPKNDKAQNNESIPPHPTSSMEVLEASESPMARCDDRPRKSIDSENAKYYYIVNFRFKPYFPQFGIEGDQDAITCGIRAPLLPKDIPLVNTTSNDTERKTYMEIYVIS